MVTPSGATSHEMPSLVKRIRAHFRRNRFQLSLLLLLSCAFLLYGPHVAYTNSPHLFPSHDTCILLGFNPHAHDLWQFSARSLCLTSDVCFDPTSPGAVLYHASDLSKTQCHIYDPDFKRASRTFPEEATLNATKQTCRSFQHQFINCAHGTSLVRAMPICPNVQSLSSTIRQSARWLEHLTIVVPDYAFSKNIYHYLNPIADLARTVENLPQLVPQVSHRSTYKNSSDAWHVLGANKVNIIFQGPRNVPLAHLWKQQLLELMIRQRILKRGIDVDLYFMQDFNKHASNVCLRNAVMLGRRGHYNVWPFPNITEVPLHGFSVPLDAVRFKQAIYDAFDIKVRLPRSSEMAGIRYSISEPPPFAVGYAKRVGRPGSDGYYRGGAMRKFFTEDEKWFTEMLRNETGAAGADLIIIPPKNRESLKKQVEDILRVGFVIGIHGANLVNAMFMHPFGVLMEIMPKNATEECYIAGANSGLKYLRMECSEEVSLLDSGCHPLDFLCKVDPRQRGVSIERVEDRRIIRQLVKEGLEHLRSIRTRFPDGIPVQYNASSTYYDILE